MCNFGSDQTSCPQQHLIGNTSQCMAYKHWINLNLKVTGKFWHKDLPFYCKGHRFLVSLIANNQYQPLESDISRPPLFCIRMWWLWRVIASGSNCDENHQSDRSLQSSVCLWPSCSKNRPRESFVIHPSLCTLSMSSYRQSELRGANWISLRSPLCRYQLEF